MSIFTFIIFFVLSSGLVLLIKFFLYISLTHYVFLFTRSKIDTMSCNSICETILTRDPYYFDDYMLADEKSGVNKEGLLSFYSRQAETAPMATAFSLPNDLFHNISPFANHANAVLEESDFFKVQYIHTFVCIYILWFIDISLSLLFLLLK